MGVPDISLSGETYGGTVVEDDAVWFVVVVIVTVAVLGSVAVT